MQWDKALLLVGLLIVSTGGTAQVPERAKYVRCLFAYAAQMSDERGQASEIAEGAFATCRPLREGVVRVAFNEALVVLEGPIAEALIAARKRAEASAADLDVRTRGLLVDAILRLRAGVPPNPAILELAR